MMAKIESVRELEVYKMAFEAAMRIFHLTKNFPAEERFSLIVILCALCAFA